jgi:hypothetical protein
MHADRSPMSQRQSVSAPRGRTGAGSARAPGLDPAGVLSLQCSAGRYELKRRQTSLDGRTVAPGEVVIAKWVADEVVNDVLQRARQLINATATEVKMGPAAFAADEARKRERTRQGSLRPG